MPSPNSKGKIKAGTPEFSIRVALLGIFVLAAITIITILSLQPLNPAVMRVILIYVFIFLSAGLLVAAVINRFMEKKSSEESA
ncbi:hypothetical protein K8S19_08515 [bacterium]|nr:hypothetical protein [bacterium]